MDLIHEIDVEVDFLERLPTVESDTEAMEEDSSTDCPKLSLN